MMYTIIALLILVFTVIVYASLILSIRVSPFISLSAVVFLVPVTMWRYPKSCQIPAVVIKCYVHRILIVLMLTGSTTRYAHMYAIILAQMFIE